MKKPKMIIFDAGRTLLDYVNIDTMKGVNALMPYIISNPQGLTAEKINEKTNEIFSYFEKCRKFLFEVPEQTILALVYDLLELKFSIDLCEIEEIIWNADAEKVLSPNVSVFLEKLEEMGIRTAVISNLDFSGKLLKAKLDELLPDNRFEFVIASSDYGIRKPNPLIFEAGIRKSELDPQDIWYVGDKLSVDIEGSKRVGMVPVLYKSQKNKYPELPKDLISLTDFNELITIIEKI